MSKPLVFRSAILNAGFRVSLSHANKGALKTDAPPEFLWDMIRAYEKSNPSTPKNWTEVAKAILGRSSPFSEIKIDFTENENAEPASKKQGLLRFQQNPPNWGPKSKARVFADPKAQIVDKRVKNQGKYKRNSIQDENPKKKEKLSTE